jgi:hypothetical protein
MEITIRVVVIFFVTLAVGSMIIMFARQALDDAKVNLRSLNVKEQQYILELGSLSVDELRALVEQCYRDKRQAAVEKELCYVLRADVGIGPADVGSFSFPVNLDFTYGNNALFIYYDVYGDEVDVEK